MPRKRKKAEFPATDIAPATEPTPAAEVLERSPVLAEILAARDAKSRIDPERPLPEPELGAEAVAAFLRQREREQAVESPPKAIRPTRQQKSWGEAVRGRSSHGSTGVRHVTTTSPDMFGIAFPKDRPRSDEEKRDMEAAGLRFFRDAEAWLKTNCDGAFDETQDLARAFAQRRREQAEAERER